MTAMARRVPISFTQGEILDVDGFVWVTLPPDTEINESRIMGTCSCDPSTLIIQQVTIEQPLASPDERWRLDIFAPEQCAAFPQPHGLRIAKPGMEHHPVRARSTQDQPVKVTVHVRRVTGGAERDDQGRLLRFADPVSFRLILLASATI